MIARNGESPKTLASVLVDRIRADIVSRVLPPGSKLRLRELSARYETGINPLREALARLAAVGLVLVEDQRGFRVAPVSMHDLEDLTRVKRQIYAIALRASIERGDVAWEARVIAAHHELARVTPSKPGSAVADEAAFEQYHRRFHTALIEACDSPWLMHFHDVLYEQSLRYHGQAMQHGDTWRDSLREHRAIMKAVLARDADAAVKLFNEHVGLTTDFLAHVRGLSP